jgi:hypothetical protein
VKVNVTADVELNEDDLGEEFAGSAAEDQARFLNAAGKKYGRLHPDRRDTLYRDICRILDADGKSMLRKLGDEIACQDDGLW